MEKKYYHDTYFQKITRLIEEYRLEEAFNEFQKYIKIYPNDVSGYIFYANAFIKNNQLEEAEKMLKKAERLLSKKTSLLTYEDFIMSKVNLLCHQKRYQECYDLFQKHIRFFYHRKWVFTGLIYFLKRELNILTPEDYERGTSYLVSQILSYEEKRALEYVKKHQSKDENDPIQFVKEFPLENTYYEIRQKLPSARKYISNNFADSYVFGYRANGHVESKLVDYIEAITITNSCDIITMYPYENSERREYIDITPEIDVSSLKRQRVSQIDKFNARYGKK